MRPPSPIALRPPAALVALLLAAVLATIGCGERGKAAEAADPGARVARGQTLFTGLGCAVCHRPDDESPGARLHGVTGTTVTLDDGRTVERDDAYLARAIRRPAAERVRGSTQEMPAYDDLSDDDVGALVAYVRSLGRERTAGG